MGAVVGRVVALTRSGWWLREAISCVAAGSLTGAAGFVTVAVADRLGACAGAAWPRLGAEAAALREASDAVDTAGLGEGLAAAAGGVAVVTALCGAGPGGVACAASCAFAAPGLRPWMSMMRR